MNTEVAGAVTAIATAVLALTSIVALVYAIMQLSQAKQSDKIRHLLSFVNEFEREPISGWRRTTAKKRLAGEEYPDEAQDILNFFETIGLLVRRGFLDIHDVWSSFSYWMFNVHADFRDDIEQEQREDGSYYLDFCNLVEGLRKVEAEEEGKGDRPSKDEISEFWEDEANAGQGQPARKLKLRKRKSREMRKPGGATNPADADSGKAASS
jgi:hypothetical protein